MLGDPKRWIRPFRGAQPFKNPGEIEARILAFQAGYEQVAQPFEWKFTRADLAQLMKKLAAQEALRSAA